jgi:hypothetical protein
VRAAVIAFSEHFDGHRSSPTGQAVVSGLRKRSLILQTQKGERCRAIRTWTLELGIIRASVIFVFGARKIADFGGAAGRSIREFRQRGEGGAGAFATSRPG